MKQRPLPPAVEQARAAALQVLHNNRCGPYLALPRTAAWGYPEPYTRDLMISALGVLTTGDKRLMYSLRRTLETLARNQSPLGHMPSLVHDPENRGASDTTPLFLLTLALFRRVTGQHDFLEEAAEAALRWMEYQSPEDRVIVAQQPTTDWRDEQWVLGHGLFVNTVLYAVLRLYGEHERADLLHSLMHRFAVQDSGASRHVHRGLALVRKPYYALWSFKEYSSERFDLLGNSLAILFGLAAPTRAHALVQWIEGECDALREGGLLAVELPPNLFPYIQRGDPDWHPRVERYNLPGQYHNGGVWPFICGFYVAALVAADRQRLARRKLIALTELVRPARERPLVFGFNEWVRAQDGQPCGQDWQTWSAAMYLYAAAAVERGTPPLLEGLRADAPQPEPRA